MSGSATFTIVTSSSSMNVPRQTATSVHHLFPRRSGTPPPGWRALALVLAGQVSVGFGHERSPGVW